MSTIQSQINLVHLQSGTPVSSVTQRTSNGSQFAANVIEVVTADETIPLADVTTAKQVFVKLISGDMVRIGLDGTTYPFELIEADESTLLRLAVESIVEVSQIEAQPDVAGSLNDKYFTLADRNGEVKVVITNDGVTALTSSGRVVVVTIANDAADTVVAAAIVTAFASDAEFSASAVGAIVTLRDKHTGTRTNVAAGDTGWSVMNFQQGAASPVIHLKSLGTSQVLVGVAPH